MTCLIRSRFTAIGLSAMTSERSRKAVWGPGSSGTLNLAAVKWLVSGQSMMLSEKSINSVA